MWEFEREKQMQQIALKKIQLVRLQEQRSYFDDLERKKKLEVETIDDIMHKYAADKADLLQAAMKRAEVLERTVNAGLDVH